MRNQPRQYLVRIDPLRLRVEVQQNPVPQNRSRQRRDVVVGHVVPLAAQGPRLCPQHNELRRANASPVVHVLLHKIRSVLALVPRRAHQADHILRQRLADRHPAHQLLELQQLLRIGHRRHLRILVCRGQVDHLQLIARAQVIQHRVEQKAVQLGLRQRVSPLQLNRVLRRQHKERRRQFIDVPPHRAAPLLHRLQHRRLRLRRSAIDLVSQHHVAEDRSLHEGPLAVAGGDVLLDDVRPGNIRGHQVRRELDAPEGQPQGLRNRPHHQRLRRSRHTRNQAMATHEQCNQYLVEHVLLPDDHLPHLRQDSVAHRLEALNAPLQLRRVFVQSRHCVHPVALSFPVCHSHFRFVIPQSQVGLSFRSEAEESAFSLALPNPSESAAIPTSPQCPVTSSARA